MPKECPTEEGVYCTREECPCMVLGKPVQEPALPDLVDYGAEVAVKMREDYGIKWHTLPKPWRIVHVDELRKARYDVATAAFDMVNRHQQGYYQ